MNCLFCMGAFFKILIMKKMFFLIIFFILYLYGFNQNQRWEVYLGTSNRKDYADDLIETYDKGYFLVGGYDGINGLSIKTDINGTVLYEKDIQSSDDMTVMAAAQDTNGNIYQCGYLVIGERSWPYIAKYDSCGNKQWCRVYFGEPEYTSGWASDIVFGDNGEIIVLTYLNSYEQNKQIFLFGFDTDGNNIWINAYATKDDYPLIANAVAYHLTKNNSEYIIIGYCYWPFPDDSNHVFLRPFFIGVDSLFEEKWILPFAVMDSVFGKAYSCIALNDSINVGVGERWIAGNSKNSILMYFNNEGEELDYIQIPNDAIGPDIIANVSRDIEKINDSVLITSSIWGSTNDGILGELILDTNGTIYNLQERADSLASSPYLIKTFDSCFVISVDIKITLYDWDILIYKIDENLESVPFDTNQYTYDSLCPHQITSSTIDLSDCLIWTDIGETPTPEEYYAKLKTIPIKAFPNPAKENITFGFENTKYHQNMQLQCFDIFGRIIFKEKIYTGQLETEINVSQWNEGLYVAVVMSEGKVLGKVKFMVLR